MGALAWVGQVSGAEKLAADRGRDPEVCHFGLPEARHDDLDEALWVGRTFAVRTNNVNAWLEGGEWQMDGAHRSGICLRWSALSATRVVFETRDTAVDTTLTLFRLGAGDVTHDNLDFVAHNNDFVKLQSLIAFTVVGRPMEAPRLRFEEHSVPFHRGFAETSDFVFDTPLTAVGTVPEIPGWERLFERRWGRVSFRGRLRDVGPMRFTLFVTNQAGWTEVPFETDVREPEAPRFGRSSGKVPYRGHRFEERVELVPGATNGFPLLPSGFAARIRGNDELLVTGTPSDLGPVSFTLSVTNAGGWASTQMTWNVVDPPRATLGYRFRSVTNHVKERVLYSFSAANGAPVSQWFISGFVPHGLFTDPSGVIGGAAEQEGTFEFGVAGSNAAGIGPGSALKIVMLPGRRPQYVGAAILEVTQHEKVVLNLRDAWSPALDCSVILGTPPPGMGAGDTHVEGTPSEVGSWTLMMHAANVFGWNTQAFEVRVLPGSGTTGGGDGTGSGSTGGGPGSGWSSSTTGLVVGETTGGSVGGASSGATGAGSSGGGGSGTTAGGGGSGGAGQSVGAGL